MENAARHTKTKIIPAEKFRHYVRKKTLKGFATIETEEGATDLLELNMTKATIIDSMPVHVGNTILMYSKLHFLKYFFILVFSIFHNFLGLSSFCETILSEAATNLYTLTPVLFIQIITTS